MIALPMFVWASLGGRSEPPTRVHVESCTTCKALVPAAEFDAHGQWHRDLERAGVEPSR